MENLNLGMNLNDYTDTDLLDLDLDELKEYNFTKIRANLASYIAGAQQTRSMNSISHITERGLNAIWGLTASSLTAATWVDYRLAILTAAQWAQDNKVYEFQLGNELEDKIDGITLTLAQLIANLKALATEAKAIFLRGKISYSCLQSYISDWATAGKGDIDLLASNIYIGGVTFNNEWKNRINSLISAFGINGIYISEFSVSYISLDSYSTDENTQKNGVTEIINYIKLLAIKEACFFSSRGLTWGYKKADGTHRQLWEVLKIQNDWKKRKTTGQKEIRGLQHG